MEQQGNGHVVNTNTFAPATDGNRGFRPLPYFSTSHSVGVIGAGAFGGWTALFLQRSGYKVTLIDAWGPGNSRSSSGDETRVIRSTYGPSELYFSMNVRALELWKEHQKKFSRQIFYNTGVLWFCYDENNPLVEESIPFAKKYGMEYEYLDNAALKSRFPLVNVDDLHHAYLDPFGGYLKAREACDEVRRLFIAEGGTYVQEFVVPSPPENSRIAALATESGRSITADLYIFACGPWLPFHFPEYLKAHINCTKQSVFYFGAPAGMAPAFDSMPAWIDLDNRNFYYGIAGNASRGFKIGVDKRGPAFDPTFGERNFDVEILDEARKFLTHRFPGLKNAPLLESRICPYENSATGNFIFDLHPEADNVFFLGGGSGHGFKHGPALGELIANSIQGREKVPDSFRIFH